MIDVLCLSTIFIKQNRTEVDCRQCRVFVANFHRLKFSLQSHSHTLVHTPTSELRTTRANS